MQLKGKALGKKEPDGDEEMKDETANPSKVNKRIFLLTDGAVSQPGEVIKTAKNGSDEARVHSYGVVYGCSKYLVKEVAKAGRGSYSFVDEKQASMLKSKVIQALSKAVEPSLKGCQFTYTQKDIILSTEGNIGEAFRHDLVS